MQNWKKYSNYRKQENVDGSITFIITVDGEDVEVSEAVYKEYAAYSRKMKYMEFDFKNDRVVQGKDGKAIRDANGSTAMQSEREVSLDKLIDENWDFPSAELSAEEAVIKYLEVESLYICLDLLDAHEQELIQALFFDGLTEREYAVKIGVVQKTINNRKRKVLEKLKKLL